MRLRFAGFGGQGVVLCGFIFGKAAMLDGRSSIHTQSYGSASRGGLTKSDVAIEDGEIYDLGHDELDLLVAMSQQSCDAYRGALVRGGMLFYEADMVDPTGAEGLRVHGLNATDLAFKQFGRKIIANMLMIGFVNGIASLVSRDSLTRTVRESVPPGTEDTNVAALDMGIRYGLAEMGAEVS